MSIARPLTLEISPQNLAYLCKAVYEDSGIVLDETKGYLVESRLAPLARREGLEGLDHLCAALQNGAARGLLRGKVVEAMTTNETLFFRDIRPFDALRDTIFPEAAQAAGTRPVRLWSAACSSGQEAYSLAMLWREVAIPGAKLEIVGSDLSEEILERAKAARYRQLEVNRGLPARMLVKYFDSEEGDWVVKPELRAMCSWRRFNLKDDMRTFGRFDIVFCRNVLIYFDQEAKADILRRIRAILAPGGYLVLGLSETTLNLDSEYERVAVGKAIVYRKPA